MKVTPEVYRACKIYAEAADRALEGIDIGPKRSEISLAASSFLFGAALAEASMLRSYGLLSESATTGARAAVMAMAKRLGEDDPRMARSLRLLAAIISAAVEEIVNQWAQIEGDP